MRSHSKQSGETYHSAEGKREHRCGGEEKNENRKGERMNPDGGDGESKSGDADGFLNRPSDRPAGTN